jgi:hypothetical protein
MIDSERFEKQARDAFEHVRPSMVELSVGGSRALGVVAERGGVTASTSLSSAAWKAGLLEEITVRQGSQSWKGYLHSLRQDWGLCTVGVGEDLPLPVLPFRRSRTLSADEPLFCVVEGSDLARPTFAPMRLVDVFMLPEQTYDRGYTFVAELDLALPAKSFAFDLEGRVAGLLEPIGGEPPAAALIAGEHVGTLAQLTWVESLLRLGELGQLARGYREHPEKYEAEALCVIGLGLERSGDRTGAIGLWTLAAAKDPRNPWPLRAAGRLLMEDHRVGDAQRCLLRAEELEAGEPRRVKVPA